MKIENRKQIIDLFVKGTTNTETKKKIYMIVIDVKKYFNNIRTYINEKYNMYKIKKKILNFKRNMIKCIHIFISKNQTFYFNFFREKIFSIFLFQCKFNILLEKNNKFAGKCSVLSH